MQTLIANITLLPIFLRIQIVLFATKLRARGLCAGRSKTYGKPDELPKPLKFGDSITADHKILNDDDASREADKVAMIILDRFFNWLQGYACKTKSPNECVKYFIRFVGSRFKPEHVYSDNSK